MSAPVVDRVSRAESEQPVVLANVGRRRFLQGLSLSGLVLAVGLPSAARAQEVGIVWRDEGCDHRRVGADRLGYRGSPVFARSFDCVDEPRRGEHERRQRLRRYLKGNIPLLLAALP